MTQNIRFFLKKINKNKWVFLLLTLLVLGAFLYYGYGKVQEETQLTAEEQESVEAYNQALTDYDVQIEDAGKVVEETTELAANLQDYVDHSIYMNLDASAIKQVSSSFVIRYEEGADAYNINTSLLTYPKEGGLKESIENPEALETAYWDDVLSVSINGNIMVITLLHYDAEKAKEIMAVIEEKYLAKVPEIAANFGGFSLTKMGTTVFEKADLNVVNTQNSNRNTLKDYYYRIADYETWRNNLRINKENYKNNAKPECLEKLEVSASSVLLKWGIMGLLAGLALGILFVYFKEYILISEEEELYRSLGLSVLGVLSHGQFAPEFARIIADFKLFAETGDGCGIHLQQISGGEKEAEAAAQLRQGAEQEDLSVSEGIGVLEKTEDLKQALQAGCCIAVVDCGKITEKELAKFMDTCRKYGIHIPGCILVK